MFVWVSGYVSSCVTIFAGQESICYVLKDRFFFFFKQDDASVLKFEVRAAAWPEKNAKVIELHKDKQVAYVRILLRICDEHVKVEKSHPIKIVDFCTYLYTCNEYSVNCFKN